MATKEWKQQNQEKLREYRRKWYAANKQSATLAVKQRKREIDKCVVLCANCHRKQHWA